VGIDSGIPNDISRLLSEVFDVIAPAERAALLADLRGLLSSYREGVY